MLKSEVTDKAALEWIWQYGSIRNPMNKATYGQKDLNRARGYVRNRIRKTETEILAQEAIDFRNWIARSN